MWSLIVKPEIFSVKTYFNQMLWSSKCTKNLISMTPCNKYSQPNYVLHKKYLQLKCHQSKIVHPIVSPTKVTPCKTCLPKTLPTQNGVVYKKYICCYSTLVGTVPIDKAIGGSRIIMSSTRWWGILWILIDTMTHIKSLLPALCML